MAKDNYVYAVARIRAKELQCLTSSFLEQLMACKTYPDCIRLLGEKGWGNGSSDITPDELLKSERDKTWAQLRELVDDVSVFGVFLYQNDFHNLKAAIKDSFVPAAEANIYNDNGNVAPEVIREAVKEHDFSTLPDSLAQAAQEALSAIRETSDGQLCDIILDRAALEAIARAGKASRSDLMSFYAEHTVATSDIKIAVRSQKTKKDRSFIRRALADCDTLDADELALAAEESFAAITTYLSRGEYAGAALALNESSAAFEKWCDNRLMRQIKPQQHEIESIDPIAAWFLARENEIKTVRILLCGKLNHLSDSAIRERLREMYV